MEAVLRVKNYISQYNFIEAKKVLLLIQSDEQLDPKELYSLFKRIDSYQKSFIKSHITYLEYLLSSSRADDVVHILIAYQGSLEIQERFCKLKALMALGQISLFEAEAETISKTLVKEKLYHYFELFMTILNHKLKRNPVIRGGLIHYYLAISKHDMAKAEFDLYARESDLSFMSHIELDLINSTTDTFQYIKNFVHLKVGTRDLLLESNIVNLILCEYQNLNYLLEVLNLLSIDEKFQLIKHIKQLPSYSFKIIKNNYPEVSQLFLSDIFVSRRDVDRKTDLITKTDEADITSLDLDEVAEDENYEYYLEKEEEELIELLNNKDKHLIELAEKLIVPFIQLRFYKLALKLAENLEKSSASLYLQSYLNCLLGNFTEVLLTINDESLLCDGAEFIYLKAEALEALGDGEAAKKYYQKVLEIAPNFKMVKWKVR